MTYTSSLLIISITHADKLTVSPHQLYSLVKIRTLIGIRSSELHSSSAIAERPRCKMGQFWPKVEDDIGLSSTTMT